MAWSEIFSSRFNPVQLHFEIMEEPVEYSHRIAFPTNTCHDSTRKLALPGEYLLACLISDNALQLPNNSRVWVGSYNGAEKVVCVLNVSYPVSQRFVDRVFEGPRASLHRVDSCSKHSHPVDVELLTFHVLPSHVYFRRETQHCAGHSRGHAVLPRSCLRDDSPFSHSLGKERLPQSVVDLVGSTME